MNTKFFDYDVVKSIRPLGENIPSGTQGTVLMVFESSPPHYEVEFTDYTGESLAVLTVREDDLEFVQQWLSKAEQEDIYIRVYQQSPKKQ